MKKHIKILKMVLFLFTAAGFSCGCKTEQIKPNNSNSTYLELDTIWTYYTGDYSIKPKLNTDGNVIISKMFSKNEGEQFELLSKEKGLKIFNWSNYFKPEVGFSGPQYLQFGDNLILNARHNSYSLNIKSGTTNWRHSSALIGEVGISNDKDGYVYHASKDNSKVTHIYRTRNNEGNWNLVCSYKDSFPINSFHVTTTSVSYNKQSDKLVIFSLVMVYNDSGENKGISKLIAFNITQNKFEWIKDYTNKYIEFMTSAPIATDNQVYYFARYGSNHFLVCINSNDGTVKWERAIPYLGTDKFLYKNSIVVMSLGAQPVLSINKETGDLIWQRDFNEEEKHNINFEFDDGTVFKNYLFSTECNNLLVLNLDNGNIVYNKKISLPNGCLQYGVAIDEARRVLYVQDRYRIICYKLPKEIVY
jgi:hypothetical protein